MLNETPRRQSSRRLKEEPKTIVGWLPKLSLPLNVAADNKQCNILFASALNLWNKAKYFHFLEMENLLKTLVRLLLKPHVQVQFFPTTTRKTFSFHLLSSLLNETPKPQSFQIKVVEDIKLSFDSYRILVSE